MLQVKAIKKNINAQFKIVSSKSETNRLLIINKLSNNKIKLNNISNSEDSVILSRLLSLIGNKQNNTYNVGMAGTVMRFMTALLSVTEGEHLITGEKRMCERPIGLLVEALKSIGADIKYINNEGYPPLLIKGKELYGGHVKIDGSVSSQFISALLMIAPTFSNGLTFEFTGNIVSFPYFNLTLKLMEKFGIKYKWKDNNVLTIENSMYSDSEYTIDADWSSISYWYEIAALSKESNINILGINNESLQGDSIVKDFYENLGVTSTIKDNSLNIKKKLTKLPNRVYFDVQILLRQ